MPCRRPAAGAEISCHGPQQHGDRTAMRRRGLPTNPLHPAELSSSHAQHAWVRSIHGSALPVSQVHSTIVRRATVSFTFFSHCDRRQTRLTMARRQHHTFTTMGAHRLCRRVHASGPHAPLSVCVCRVPIHTSAWGKWGERNIERGDQCH
jgi:hypothetical protein